MDDDDGVEPRIIRPNCPKCLHPTEPHLGEIFAGWQCPECGELVTIEEVTHPSWWASTTTGWKPEHGYTFE